MNRWIKKLMLAASGLTFAACYGPMWVEYDVKGRVVDPDGNPIEGIAVMLGYCPYDYYEGDDSADLSGLRPDALTNARGEFRIRTNADGGASTICLHDIDGPLNGGEFASQRVEVNFSREDYGDPYEASGVEVVMIPKSAAKGDADEEE